MPRILLVEDDPIEARAYARFLAESAEVLVAKDLSDARRLLASAAFDGAVIDLTLPDGLGFELVPEIREAHPAALLLLHSGHDDRATLRRACALAVPFGLKSSASLLRTFASQCGSRSSGPPSHTRLRPALDLAAVFPDANLTPREVELIELAMLGLTRTELEDRLGISTSTCGFHITNILRKTGQARMGALVAWLRQASADYEDLQDTPVPGRS